MKYDLEREEPDVEYHTFMMTVRDCSNRGNSLTLKVISDYFYKEFAMSIDEDSEDLGSYEDSEGYDRRTFEIILPKDECNIILNENLDLFPTHWEAYPYEDD